MIYDEDDIDYESNDHFLEGKEFNYDEDDDYTIYKMIEERENEEEERSELNF